MFIFALFTLVLSQDESLTIQSPQELAKNAELAQIPFIITEYSYVPYGQNISGVLEVANPYNFCTPKFNRSVDRSSDQSNVKILLIQRGGCSFMKKSINAQLFGYQIVVIVDDREQKISDLMIPDKEGSEVNISTMMISKKQGDLIKQYMDANDKDKENVQIVVKFPDIPKTDIVRYNYYFGAMRIQEYLFLQQFYPFHMEMKDQLEFTPYFASMTCFHAKFQIIHEKIKIACLEVDIVNLIQMVMVL